MIGAIFWKLEGVQAKLISLHVESHPDTDENLVTMSLLSKLTEKHARSAITAHLDAGSISVAW